MNDISHAGLGVRWDATPPMLRELMYGIAWAGIGGVVDTSRSRHVRRRTGGGTPRSR